MFGKLDKANLHLAKDHTINYTKLIFSQELEKLIVLFEFGYIEQSTFITFLEWIEMRSQGKSK